MFVLLDEAKLSHYNRHAIVFLVFATIVAWTALISGWLHALTP